MLHPRRQREHRSDDDVDEHGQPARVVDPQKDIRRSCSQAPDTQDGGEDAGGDVKVPPTPRKLRRNHPQLLAAVEPDLDGDSEALGADQ